MKKRISHQQELLVRKRITALIDELYREFFPSEDDIIRHDFDLKRSLKIRDQYGLAVKGSGLNTKLDLEKIRKAMRDIKDDMHKEIWQTEFFEAYLGNLDEFIKKFKPAAIQTSNGTPLTEDAMTVMTIRLEWVNRIQEHYARDIFRLASDKPLPKLPPPDPT